MPTDLSSFQNDKGQVWLNVASSHYPVEGFVNLDNHIMLRAIKYPFLQYFVPKRNAEMLNTYKKVTSEANFFRHDCRKALPVPDGTVDHILCSHFLEHVHPDEGLAILRDFKRALKPNATMHIIVPDLEVLIDRYVAAREGGDEDKADAFVKKSLLSTESRGSMKFRIMEASGGFGLKHLWMYDNQSMTKRIKNLNFEILDQNETPSREFRKGDDSVHVVARKPAT